MNRQLCFTAGSLALGIGLAFPSAAADPAGAAVTKAGIGIAAVGLAVAAPAAFVAVVGVGTVLMVRSIAETVSRAPHSPARLASRSTDAADSPFPASGWYPVRNPPAGTAPAQATQVAVSSPFPVSTGLYGSFVPAAAHAPSAEAAE